MSIHQLRRTTVENAAVGERRVDTNALWESRPIRAGEGLGWNRNNSALRLHKEPSPAATASDPPASGRVSHLPPDRRFRACKNSKGRWISGTVVLCAIMTVAGLADEVPFRRHTINSQSEFSAAAAIDVNQDGRLDIVSGGFWYEAPTWKRRYLRDVQQIRGRFDDYSNLPLDVNRDGLIDLVSVNYRSRSLYWVENSGKSLMPWNRHVIDTPGASETGRLADVDGDGLPDILPNGTKFAAWYRLEYSADAQSPNPFRWVRHDLPKEAAGHGIGFGDIDGDGQGDLVTANGWLRAPNNPRTERWIWQPEFQLHRDCSIPILVHDWDADGDVDVVWGRGHDVGIYWLEQSEDNGRRTWIWHAIDTSWSEAHSLMLADIDGDGRQDFVAGKRFMGHDGKDPGEYDPLVVYWYRFDSDRRVWDRQLISWGGICGMDLDPKCVDLDQDGDLDILAPARCGLSYLENLGQDQDAAGKATNVPPTSPEYQRHDELLVYQGDRDALQPIETRLQWGVRRSHILLGMQQAMGQLPGPSRRVPLDLQVHETTEADGYVRKRISYLAEPGDRVPAFLLIPNSVTQRAPAMLCLHPTSPLGKSQICGLGGKPSRFYAHELAQRGFVCLAPDYPSFGEYAYDFRAADDSYDSGSMKAIWNNIRAIDLLESLPDVDRQRIGCIGHSLGGHNALFTAAFDQRIRRVVTSCGFTAFEDYYGGDLTGWTSDRYMPRIKSTYGSDPARMPFDFHEVIAAIAPRPLFVSAPLEDSNFEVSGVKKVEQSARQVYELCGAESALRFEYPDAKHDFPSDVRQTVYRWLEGK